MNRYLLIATLLLVSLGVSAEDIAIRVMALFSGKVYLQVNGEQKIVKQGESFKGVTLVSASGRGAVVRLKDGKELKLGLNQSIQHGFKKAEKNKLTVYPDRMGMFSLSGKINGQPTFFLLDTGATSIAISEVEADRLGIAYESGRKGKVQTASEVVPVWNIKLDNVKVGDISVSQVDAVVLKGNNPRTALLGMSFLKHINLQRNGTSMVLEQKY
ncbi:MAG: retropepsin-like aspartic protease [Gammaproteobacteria bacterium]|nr:retropepsin-like aspartic protease [Gammaproteobacteria bacterium]